MNAIVKRDHFDLSEIFTPPDPKTIAGLVEEHHAKLTLIHEVAAAFTDNARLDAMQYFFDGCEEFEARGGASERMISKLFVADTAAAALHAEFWERLLNLTDVLDYMPQKRKDEWYEDIKGRKVAPFTPETIRATLAGLLADRHKFLAEKVDGVFRALSGEHVTNSPQGFRKRMIIAGVIDDWGIGRWSRCGVINDLRQVVAKFMGRDEPKDQATTSVIKWARDAHTGQWVSLDGGAMRIRVYKKGTAHLEIHPEMAWRLNCVLASLYPMALSSESRQRPKRKVKDIVLMERPLPFAVLALLRDTIAGERSGNEFGTWGYAWSNADKHVKAEAFAVLKAIGAVVDGSKISFDYNPRSVINEIIATGCIPDAKAHQFYPTPRDLVERMVELAEIGPTHNVLEPSAGHGGIADMLPADRTACVEVSKLHCEILRSKGFTVQQGDFLKGLVVPGAFDRVVMNPPFDRGQWRAHVEEAAIALRAGGRLVAVLPVGAAGKDVLPGWAFTWSEPIDFPGTSIQVVILTADKPR